jgi:hypothetical protein
VKTILMCLTRWFKSCDFKQNDYNEYIHLKVKIFRCGLLKNGCFLGLVALLLAGLNLAGRTPPDASDPLGFFSSIADKMLRSTFNFGVTNIPVCSNGVFVYSPAVQRILQLSANVFDASNTNFFPTVFRPVFWVTNESGCTNVYVNGYEDVSQYSSTNTLTIGLPPLDPPVDVTSPLLASNAQLTNYYGNVYGVPWIIGAKKGLPNFYQFYMNEVVQITRKLEVTRRSTNLSSSDYRSYDTNQMYVMSITNNLGISFWNSYSNFYPNTLTVYASDWLSMTMTNGANTWVANANFVVPSIVINSWPGSQWGSNMLPPIYTPNINAGSFYYTNWSFAFLPESVYRFAAATFVPISSHMAWETNLAPCELPPLPPFELMTTNCLQAFILDGNNVIDYVQLSGPFDNTSVNQVLADPDYPDATLVRYQWSTNLYQLPSSLTYGVYNQIVVSENPGIAPGNSWVRPAGMPPYLPSTPSAESAFFNGFFVPNFQFNGQIYTNSQPSVQVPYTPTRTVYNYIQWQANDPLVHYLASDLNYVNPGIIGWKYSDDPNTEPLPVTSQNTPGPRFQPWGLNRQMAGLANVDTSAYNLAFKDPLVWCSDNWNFPTNLLSALGGLGQVHRGTPWQTVYLKAANILNECGIFGNLGTNTWMQWTGDTDPNDAALMAPANDWRLAGLLISLLNTNDATQLVSVNDPNIADWLNVLNGLTVYSNSVAYPFPSYTTAPQFDTYVMASNSPQTLVVANGIAQVRAIQPNQNFYFIGDILATPELTGNSPWLNTNSSSPILNQLQYGITDAAYEAIPTQLLQLLRPDSIGAMLPTNGGWSLQFSGSDSYAYALQTSTNLVNWDRVSTNYPVQGRFCASPLQNSSARFYRTVLLP